MSPLEIGALIGLVTVLVLGSGIPVAFGLTAVALFFLAIFEGPDSLIFTGELFFSGLSNFTLVSIPMFIAMGAAVASSPAGSDLYGALDRWLTRVPGGLAISNIGACSIFAASVVPRQPPAQQLEKWAFQKCASMAIQKNLQPAQ